MGYVYTNIKTGRLLHIKSAEEVATRAYEEAYKRQTRNIEKMERSTVWVKQTKAPHTEESGRRRVSAAGTLRSDGCVR